MGAVRVKSHKKRQNLPIRRQNYKMPSLLLRFESYQIVTFFNLAHKERGFGFVVVYQAFCFNPVLN
jgi:hypothetical protein